MRSSQRLAALAGVLGLTASVISMTTDHAVASGAARATPVATVLAGASPVGTAGVITNDRGVSLAMWLGEANGKPFHLGWAVRRSGGQWTSPRVKLGPGFEPHHVPYLYGARPSLALTTGHRVAATWLDHQGRVVLETWSPSNGWSRPTRFSNARHRALWPTLASNAAGRLALTWEMGPVGSPHRPGSAMVAVQRDGTWTTHRAGLVSRSFGTYAPRPRIGVAGDGAVTVVWQHLLGGEEASTTATTLPAGSTTWEAPHVFGDEAVWGERFPIGLAVQPDGSAVVDTEDVSGAQRLPGGDWTSSDFPFLVQSLTTSAGALVTWNDLGPSDVYQDPDGLAGPSPVADLGRPAFTGSEAIPHVSALPDGTLVDVAVSQHELLYSVRPPGGDWSAPVVVRSFTRFLDGFEVTDSMSADGTVDVLLGTSPRLDGHLPSDLRAVRFRPQVVG
jgi:hypothetical protein